MDKDQKIKMLQMIYAGALADTVYYYGQAGVLEQVTEAKKKVHLKFGKTNAERFGVKVIEEIFTVLPDLFACADWKITHIDKNFTAVATSCLLCAMAKKIGAPSPCHIYCLDSMEAMVKGLEPTTTFDVQSTLWDKEMCCVNINR